jgi:GT2 family glycosyltransferase
MVDNLSQDESVPAIRNEFPQVKIIENNVNNYSKALNLGVQASKGAYAVFLNPDTIVDENWLVELMKVMSRDERIGAVQSKILFLDGKTINSAGGEKIEDFYFRDIGFGQEDRGQYEKIKEPEFVSGGSVLYRRTCLDDVGGIDEDFVMYYEDVDYSFRCHDRGWRIFYAPKSVVYHKFHGVTSLELCDYYCSRNRMLFLAKHFPYELPGALKTSHFYINNDMGNLHHSLIQAVKKMAENQTAEITSDVLDYLKDVVPEILGARRTINFLKQLEVVLDLRKIKIGIYNHTFHFVGGGQRYAATMAENLQNKYDITLISNKDIELERYKEWFDLDLSGCKLKIIKIPFFERDDLYHIDEGMVVNETVNPFDIISDEIREYDIFINTNMLTKVKPLSSLSIFISHFPDREKEKFFSVDQYDYLLTNSNYGSYWLKKKWGLDTSLRLYPSVNMYHGRDGSDGKSKIILSVARFESGGSKKQLEMIKAFCRLCDGDNYVKNEWRLIIAGSS